jgi:hypothetical protein
MKIYNFICAVIESPQSATTIRTPIVHTHTSMSISDIVAKFNGYKLSSDYVTMFVQEFDTQTGESTTLHYFAGNENDE